MQRKRPPEKIPKCSLLEDMMVGFALVYLVFTGIFYAFHFMQSNIITFSPDYVLFAIIFATIALGRDKIRAVKDFGPPTLLLLAYDAMRGYADNFGSAVNYQFPIAADTLMGGGELPGRILQTLVDGTGYAAFFEITGVTVYTLHFLVPLIFGYLLWLESPELYRRYMASFLIISYSSLVTFWLFPVAPPWLAAENGIISMEHKYISVSEKYTFGGLPTIYWFMNANLVAAVPSLHFAYPFLAFIYACAYRKKLAAIFLLIYTLVVTFSIIYLGEHYVIDAIIGAIYCLGVVFAKDRLFKDSKALRAF